MDSEDLSRVEVDGHGRGRYVIRIPAHWQRPVPLEDREWGYYGENMHGIGYTERLVDALRFRTIADAVVECERVETFEGVEATRIELLPLVPAHRHMGSSGTGGRA